MGAYAGGERRSDRSDPHSSLLGRWRTGDPVQHDLPASPHLPRMGAVPTQRRGQHRALRRTGTRSAITDGTVAANKPSCYTSAMRGLYLMFALFSLRAVAQTPLEKIEPDYSDEARLAGLEGTVQI